MKWQKEAEEIIKKNFPDGSPELLKEATKIVDTVGGMNPPAGDLGKVIGEMMTRASLELSPLSAVYAGFMLGVAWERYGNVD